MKKKFFMAVAALSLSMALAVPASVFTTQAAESGVFAAHVHNMRSGTSYVDYEEANSQYHWRYVRVDYECTGCNYSYTVDLSEEYQLHDLSGYSDGKWCCIYCDYEEYPGTRCIH